MKHDREDPMRRAAELRHQREERWRREGERSLSKNLALVGVLGWLVVMPALLGAYVGRRIDHALKSGVTFTAALLLAGATLGAAIGWKRIKAA